MNDKNLIPLFCCKCGDRVCWAEEEPHFFSLYCEDCKKGDKQ